MVQLYAMQSGNYILLDIFSQEPIRITERVEQTTSLNSSSSAFSRTFRLPYTARNEEFFRGVFNVNSIDFDATQKTPAIINTEGFFYAQGNIRLTNIFNNPRDKSIEYELLFMGSTSDFGSNVGEKFLCECDLSQYSHAQSYTNIVNSWNASTSATGGTGLFSGAILYPLVEWGYTYDNANTPQQSTCTDGYSQSFTSSSNPLSLKQLKPAIRASVIWDKIFTDAGYSYTGTFFNSSRWNSLYLLTESTARAELDADITGEIGGRTTPTEVFAVSDQLVFNRTITVFRDPSNSFSSQGVYTASATGSYTFDYQFNGVLDYEPISGNGFIGYQLQSPDGSTVYANDFVGFSGGSPPLVISHTGTFTFSMNPGEQLQFVSFADPSSTGFYSLRAEQVTLSCTSAPQIVNPTAVLPCNYKQIDFIRACIERFKLVLIPSREDENTFIIEPWVDWIKTGRNVDWTDKLDSSRDQQISPLFYTQNREILYQDAVDTDWPNFFYTQDFKKPYGQFRLDSGIQLIKGTRESQEFFAPTPLVSIASASGTTAANQFLIPSISKDNAPTSNVGRREPIQNRPRLVFYNGKRNSQTWYLDNGGTATAQIHYPLVSTFEDFDLASNGGPIPGTLDLHWQNYPPIWNPNGISGRTDNTVWSQYWQTWYDSYYSPYGRILTAYFNLHDEDIRNLKFSDRIFVLNSWWFPIEISDHALGSSEPTRVVLYKLGNEMITL